METNQSKCPSWEICYTCLKNRGPKRRKKPVRLKKAIGKSGLLKMLRQENCDSMALSMMLTHGGWFLPRTGHCEYFSYGIKHDKDGDTFGPKKACPYILEHSVLSEWQYRIIDEKFYDFIIKEIEEKQIIFFKNSFYLFDKDVFDYILGDIKTKSLVYMDKTWEEICIDVSKKGLDEYFSVVLETLEEKETKAKLKGGGTEL